MADNSLNVELNRIGAILTDDHFVYTKGGHGKDYVDKDRVYPHTELLFEITNAMIEPFLDENIEAVVGPELGAVVLSSLGAYHLSQRTGKEVLSFIAEKDRVNGGFIIKRGGAAEFLTNRRVLVVEDILNTGGSVKEVVHAVREMGGLVVGVSAMVNRGGVTAADVGNPHLLTSLLEVSLEQWSEEDCPMCKSNVPINTRVGKGADFLARTRSGP